MVLSRFSLCDEVAMVTGATGGIGRAACIAFAQAGVDLALVDLEPLPLQNLVNEIRGIGRDALALIGDVSNRFQIEDVVEKAVKHFSRIDILFNNVGVGVRRPFLETEETDWDRIIDINLKGAFLVAQAVARRMAEKRSGVIINTASIAGLVGRNHQSAYCASKGGVAQLTKVMAMDLAPWGIRVNSISPGMIQTPMTASYFEADDTRERRISSKIPLGRLGTPDDLVGALLYLASAASIYVTGQTIVIDGGWTTGIETD